MVVRDRDTSACGRPAVLGRSSRLVYGVGQEDEDRGVAGSGCGQAILLASIALAIAFPTDDLAVMRQPVEGSALPAGYWRRHQVIPPAPRLLVRMSRFRS